ncbi:MAG: DUF3617 domain-containing protein [Ramlibacter sp.]|nr:DUF3617 domain-containing protein [Ramlibacter sp.]
MKLHHLLAAALAAFATTAGAQALKPGLWEVTHKTNSGNSQMDQQMAQMQKQMAAMPPAQRKQMEEMMAKNGTQMPAAAPGGGMSMKMCMTREMAERSEIPAQQGDCKTTHQSRSGNTMKMAFTCTNPPSSGEGQYTFTSPEAYSMKMAVSTTVQGKPHKMNMEGSGKWLGADCGSIKPIAPPKK